MKSLSIVIGLAAMSFASPAAAQHLANLNTPYANRGACESAVASFNDDVRDVLVDNFSQFFSSEGEAASYLTRAFPCDLDEASGDWYIRDRRGAVVASDWFQRRLN